LAFCPSVPTEAAPSPARRGTFALFQLLEHVDQVPDDRIVLPVPQRPVDQLPMKAVRGPEGPKCVGQLRDPVHALIVEEHLEGVGAFALEMLAVQIGHHPINFLSGTLSAPANRSSVPSVGSCRPASRRMR
jgi:hypothetical protein